MALSRAYLSPGLFGFYQIGAYAYFRHFEKALAARYADAGRELRVHFVEAFPTASIRRRAKGLAAEIDRTASPTDTLHLVGHSTGGLDARLLASPATVLSNAHAVPELLGNIRSVTTMNAPHYGTPLAGFFTTVSGQRFLRVLSALTVLALKASAPPLSITSSVVAALGRVDRAFGFELTLLEKLTETIVTALDDASRHDLRLYLGRMQEDQGGLLQLSLESMDIFQATVQDNPGIRYQCTASYAPAPSVLNWARTLAAPWTSPSGTIFATLYRITALQKETYPCGPVSAAWDGALIDKLGQVPQTGANDGVVPFRSQLWGDLIWVGQGDHLDVVGHFDGGKAEPDHHDWLSSGARFDRRGFDTLVDAVARGMLRAE